LELKNFEDPSKKFKSYDPWMSDASIGVKTLKIRRKNSIVMTPVRQLIRLELKTLKIRRKNSKVITPGRQMI
jgi:hypothetical protein